MLGILDSLAVAVLALVLFRRTSDDSDLRVFFRGTSVEVEFDGEDEETTGLQPNVTVNPWAKVNVRFDNRGNESVELYWVHPDKEDVVLQGTMDPGASTVIDSYIGHRFYFTSITISLMIHI